MRYAGSSEGVYRWSLRLAFTASALLGGETHPLITSEIADLVVNDPRRTQGLQQSQVVARTRIKSSPSAGTGTGTFSMRMTSGVP